jgi:threonine dehydrogenase-like Zn-dependent dehydrogenase
MTKGVFGGHTATVDVDKIVLRDLTIRGTVGSPGMKCHHNTEERICSNASQLEGVWKETAELLTSTKIRAEAIVTHQWQGLERFQELLQIVRTRQDNVVKAVIEQVDEMP